MASLSRLFRFFLSGHWPGPRSLAATNGVSVDVLSSGYLDVSVRRVCLIQLCIHCTIPDKSGGFPHSEILGSKPARGSPKLIATCYVLHRLYTPRHPLNALLYLRSSRLLNETVMCRDQPNQGHKVLNQSICSRSFSVKILFTLILGRNTWTGVETGPRIVLISCPPGLTVQAVG